MSISTIKNTFYFFEGFKKKFGFIVSVSLLYELIVIAHTSTVCTWLGLEQYGLLVSLLSVIHMGTHFADWGMTNSITPHLHLFQKSARSWKNIFFTYTLIPHSIFALLTAIVSITYLAATPFQCDSWMVALLGAMIFLGTIQSYMRQLLYALLKTTQVALTELIILITRLIILWSTVFLNPSCLSSRLILWSHLGSDIICLLLFSYYLWNVYKSLPSETSNNEVDELSVSRILYQRASNYTLRLSRSFLSAHCITPFFALQFGLKTAGLFYLATKLAKMIQAVIKLSIGYAGNGLLAHVKMQPLVLKQAAFRLLSTALLKLIVLSIALCAPVGAALVHFGNLQDTPRQACLLCGSFLLLTFLEFFFMLYEQWYILEELGHQLFLIKIIEMAGAFFIIYQGFFSPVMFLICIIALRIFHVIFIMLHAKHRWGIVPVQYAECAPYVKYGIVGISAFIVMLL